ncbi:MAG: GNAT family N-acetyltransferase, partial [Myxococcota bacterium]
MGDPIQERARFATRRQCRDLLAHLDRAPRENLLLIEVVREMARTWRNTGGQVVGVWRGGEVVGVVSLRPTIGIDVGITPGALSACLPLLTGVEAGLIKSHPEHAGPVWEGLRGRGRQALIDRSETAYLRVRVPGEDPSPLPQGAVVRRAEARDLEPLVDAARASLREESRPDPFIGDPDGFRSWLSGRVDRARLVEVDGRPVFVCYADVKQPEGWLIQGVYTWPHARHRGYARAGIAALLEEAWDAGADHVQLAVVNGNVPAVGLYTGLGFTAF